MWNGNKFLNEEANLNLLVKNIGKESGVAMHNLYTMNVILISKVYIVWISIPDEKTPKKARAPVILGHQIPGARLPLQNMIFDKYFIMREELLK